MKALQFPLFSKKPNPFLPQLNPSVIKSAIRRWPDSRNQIRGTPTEEVWVPTLVTGLSFNWLQGNKNVHFWALLPDLGPDLFLSPATQNFVCSSHHIKTALAPSKAEYTHSCLKNFKQHASKTALGRELGSLGLWTCSWEEGFRKIHELWGALHHFPLMLGTMVIYLFHYRPLLCFKLLLIRNVCFNCHCNTDLVSCNFKWTEMFPSIIFLSRLPANKKDKCWSTWQISQTQLKWII